MTTALNGRDEQVAGPPADLRYRKHLHPVAELKELWASRNLVFSLAERDVRARYKQAFLGFTWAIVSPVLLMIVFTIFFRRAIKVETGAVPYPLYTYVALVPWTFFSSSISSGGTSLVGNNALLNKVYCPREVFPLGTMATAAVDTFIALGVLGVLFLFEQFLPKGTSFWVPVLLLLQLGWTIGLTLVLSIVTVYLRDLRHALPIFLQLGLFATPVAYGIDKVPIKWQGLYSLLNPLAPVIYGYRQTVLYGRPPNWRLVGLGGITATVVLVGGYLLFKRLETGIADVA